MTALDIPLYGFERALAEQLIKAEMPSRLEEARKRKHNILVLEKEGSTAEMIKRLIKLYQGKFKIPAKNSKLNVLEIPPKRPEEFTEMMGMFSGYVLHNLSLENLYWIQEAISRDFSLIEKIVLIKKGLNQPEQNKAYSDLAAMGMLVIEKPISNFAEIANVVLGLYSTQG